MKNYIIQILNSFIYNLVFFRYCQYLNPNYNKKQHSINQYLLVKFKCCHIHRVLNLEKHIVVIFEINHLCSFNVRKQKENLTSNLDQSRVTVCKFVSKRKNPKMLFMSQPLGERLTDLWITQKGSIMGCFWCHFWIPHPKKRTWVKFQSQSM